MVGPELGESIEKLGIRDQGAPVARSLDSIRNRHVMVTADRACTSIAEQGSAATCRDPSLSGWSCRRPRRSSSTETIGSPRIRLSRFCQAVVEGHAGQLLAWARSKLAIGTSADAAA